MLGRTKRDKKNNASSGTTYFDGTRRRGVTTRDGRWRDNEHIDGATQRITMSLPHNQRMRQKINAGRMRMPPG